MPASPKQKEKKKLEAFPPKPFKVFFFTLLVCRAEVERLLRGHLEGMEPAHRLLGARLGKPLSSCKPSLLTRSIARSIK